ncbi:MAG: hypothetical protein ACUVXF_05475 [Desulfobaccales bacterium]
MVTVISPWPRVASGVKYLGVLLGGLFISDNVLWYDDTGSLAAVFCLNFIQVSQALNKPFIYVSFDRSPKNLLDKPRDPDRFLEALYGLHGNLQGDGRFIFESLTGMQELWGSEDWVFGFYTHSCPWLYELNTVAYLIIEKTCPCPSVPGSDHPNLPSGH